MSDHRACRRRILYRNDPHCQAALCQAEARLLFRRRTDAGRDSNIRHFCAVTADIQRHRGACLDHTARGRVCAHNAVHRNIRGLFGLDEQRQVQRTQLFPCSIFVPARKVFFYGVLTILPYYLIIPGWPAWDVFMKPQVVGNLLFLGCLASMICFLTWNWCISKLGAVKATNWVYFNPITTMIFASLVLDEKITPYFLAGACCILAGMYIADRMTKSE